MTVLLVATLGAALLTGAIRQLAMRHGLLDHPNPRSAHAAPLPVGGGAAIAIVVCAWLALAPSGDGTGRLLALAGAVIATVGLVDDRRSVSKWMRLAVHAVAVGAVLAITRQLGPLQAPGLPLEGWLAAAVALFALMWLVNLYNFMDGIDGLAAIQAVNACLGMAACLQLGAYDSPVALTGFLVTAGASLGFLAWNWPPARIFMGDVGSGFLGFVIGALALVAHREAGLSLWVPLILLALFVSDATLTLLRRMLRGERWYEPHRLHAYQWLSRRFGAHRPVTLIALGVNLLWLTPLAVAAARRPELAGWIACIAYVPVVVGVLLAGAGRPEGEA